MAVACVTARAASPSDTEASAPAGAETDVNATTDAGAGTGAGADSQADGDMRFRGMATGGARPLGSRAATVTTRSRHAAEVLVVYSYSQLKGYTRMQQLGITETLRVGLSVEPTILEEYLHAEQPMSEAIESRLVELFAQRYSGHGLSAVITADTPATEFVARHWERMFPGVPVIFSASVRVPPEIAERGLPFTGVVETPAVKETLELARSVFPRTRRVLVVSPPRHETGRLQRATSEALEATGLEGVWLSEMDREAGYARLAAAGDEEVILYLEGTGSEATIAERYEVKERVLASAARPMFALYSAHITSEPTVALAGVVSCGQAYGHRAAELAVRVIEGDDPRSLGVVVGANGPMASASQMERWGVSRPRLPVETIVVSAAPSFLVRNAWWILGAALVLGAQSVAIAALVVARRRARDLAARAAEDEGRLRVMAENLPGAVYSSVRTATGKRWMVYASAGLERLLGKELAAACRVNLDAYFECVSEADRARVMEEAAEAAREGRPMDIVYAMTIPGRADPLWVRSIARATVQENGDRLWHGVLLDVTRERLAEEAMRESEERYRALASVQSDAVADTDLATGQMRWTEGYARVFKYPWPEPCATMEVCFSRIHEEDRAWIEPEMMRAIHSGKTSWSGSCRYRRGDGVYVHVEKTLAILHDGLGRARRVIGSMRDVTEQVLARAAQEEDSRRLREIVERAGAVFFEVEPTTLVFTYVSPQAERLLGFPVERWREPGFWASRLHGEDAWAATYCMTEAAAGRDHRFEYRMLAADGRVVWISDVATMVRDAAGNVVQMRGMMLDVTESRRLRREREQFFELSLDALVVMAFDTREGVRHISPAAARVLDRTAAELADGWAAFTHPEDLEASLQVHERLTRGEIVSGFRARVLRRDGRTRTLEWTAAPDMEARLIYAVGRDVTDSERDARMMAQTNRAAKIGGWELDVTTGLAYFTDQTRRIHELEGARTHHEVSEALAFYTERSRKKVMSALDAAIERGTPFDLEAEFRTAKGRLIWVQVMGFAEMRQGRAVRVWGSIQDVTERREAEAALRESEARLRAIAENSGDVFWAFDHVNKRSLYVSRAFERIWGFDAARLRENSEAFHDAVHPEDRERVMRASARIERGYDITFRIVRPDGEVRWIRDRASPVTGRDGRVREIVGVAADVTAEQEVLAERQRTAELQRLLLSELDHRVKNTLAGLLALIDQTAKSARGVGELATSIRQRVDTMLAVHTLLSERRFKPLELGGLIRSLFPPGSRCELKLEGAEISVPARQATAMALVVQELMTNSVKHGVCGHESGVLRVSWDAEAAEGRTRVQMRWQETGGPSPAVSPQRGLGTRLIDGFTRFELAGSADLHFGEAGVDHAFVFHLDGEHESVMVG